MTTITLLARKSAIRIRSQTSHRDIRHTCGMVAAVACVLAAGCKKTANGDVVVQTPKGVLTAPDTVHMPSVGTTTDTVTTPTVTTKPETLIVKKPVVGSTKRVVHRPTTKP